MTPEQLEACRHLLWHYGDRENGWRPGSFHTSLIRCLETADMNNRGKLLEAFPEYVLGVTVLRTVGAETLSQMVVQESA